MRSRRIITGLKGFGKGTVGLIEACCLLQQYPFCIPKDWVSGMPLDGLIQTAQHVLSVVEIGGGERLLHQKKFVVIQDAPRFFLQARSVAAMPFAHDQASQHESNGRAGGYPSAVALDESVGAISHA